MKGFYRVTGYLDAESGRLVKQESYSHDDQGWYRLDFDDFDYGPAPDSAFDPDTLAKTSRFELAVPAISKKG